MIVARKFAEAVLRSGPGLYERGIMPSRPAPDHLNCKRSFKSG